MRTIILDMIFNDTNIPDVGSIKFDRYKENLHLLTSNNTILYMFYAYINLGKDLSVILNQVEANRKYLVDVIEKAASE